MTNSPSTVYTTTSGAFLQKCMICNERQLFAKKMHYSRSLGGYLHKRCMINQESLMKRRNNQVNFGRQAEETNGNERPVAAADNRRSEDIRAKVRGPAYPPLPLAAIEKLDRLKRHNALMAQNPKNTNVRIQELNPSTDTTDRRMNRSMDEKNNEVHFAPRSLVAIENKRPDAAADRRRSEDHRAKVRGPANPPLPPAAVENLDQLEHHNILVAHCSKSIDVQTQMNQKLKLLKDTTDQRIDQLMKEINKDQQKIKNLTDLKDTLSQKIDHLIEENDNKEQEIRNLTEISLEKSRMITSTPTPPCSNCGFIRKGPSEIIGNVQIADDTEPELETVTKRGAYKTFIGYMVPMAAIVERMRSETTDVPFELIVRVVPAMWAEFVAMTVNDAMTQGVGEISSKKQLRYAIGMVALLHVAVAVSLIDGNGVKIEVYATEEDFLRILQLRFVIVYDFRDGYYQIVQCPANGVEVTKKFVIE